jgi:hypothetical protein
MRCAGPWEVPSSVIFRHVAEKWPGRPGHYVVANLAYRKEVALGRGKLVAVVVHRQ